TWSMGRASVRGSAAAVETSHQASARSNRSLGGDACRSRLLLLTDVEPNPGKRFPGSLPILSTDWLRRHWRGSPSHGLQRRPKRDPFSAGCVIRSRERAAPMSRRDCDPRAWFRLGRNDGYDPFVWVVRLDRLDVLDRREPAVRPGD